MNATQRMTCKTCKADTIHTAMRCCHCNKPHAWPKLLLKGFAKQTLLGRPERKTWTPNGDDL